MELPDRVVTIACKTIGLVSRIAGIGAGGTWPGEIALRLRSKIIASFFSEPVNIVLVAGTNGKTTTVKMIESILRAAGLRVAHNASGANLDNGIVSSFIDNCDWLGQVRADHFIFEVDEAILGKIMLTRQGVKASGKGGPKIIIVLLNLFRDQLDRYGEVDTIVEKWKGALADLGKTDTVLINADDAHLAHIGSSLSADVHYFGLNDTSFYLPKMQHATDSIYCPNCLQRLTFGGVYFSHLGKYACGRCGFKHPDIELAGKHVKSPLEGVYNLYNTMAATLLARMLGIPQEIIERGLATFAPAFGRLETLIVNRKTVKILLSKNPTGFNESLRTFLHSSQKGPLLLVLNDRIPDGTDVSWIWDVDFEVLESPDRLIIVSGDRCWDMGVRLKYAQKFQIPNPKFQTNPKSQIQKFEVEKVLRTAVAKGIKETNENESLWILSTYSAMLEVRNILIGRKIL